MILNVKTLRPEVSSALPTWGLIRDCLEGQKAIKAPNNATTYLPMPNTEGNDTENALRYKPYLERAVFYNVTARTLAGMVGQVYSKPPVVELPEALQIFLEDIAGTGISLEQQSKRVLRNVLGLGRAGLLADYPATGDVATKADLATGDIRPTITAYDPEDIVNWRTATRGGRVVLTLLVLREVVDLEEDSFGYVTEDRYRVLRLDKATGFVKVEIYTDRMKEGAVTLWPTDFNGANLTEIPFVFVGVENNDTNIDDSPMYDLAVLNVAHYRNSADFEESSFIVGQATPYFTGLNEHWVTQVLKGKVRLGSMGGVLLPPGATAGLLQAQPNNLPMAAMQAKEQQMVALGARLVQMQVVQRTATEASQDKVSEVSVLASAARNTSAAYMTAFRFAAKYVNADTASIKFELTTDYEVAKMTPQEQLQLVASWQVGAITDNEMRTALRKGGIAVDDDATWESATGELRTKLIEKAVEPAAQTTKTPTTTKAPATK